MKRALSSRARYVGLALIVFLSLAGCNKNSNSGGNSNNNNSSSNSSSTTNNSSSSSSSGKSSGSSRFVGTWKPADNSDPSVGSLTIKDDGTFTIKAGGQDNGPSLSGTYTSNGDSITLKDPEGKGDDATATIEADGRLKIADKSGQSEYFVKQ